MYVRRTVNTRRPLYISIRTHRQMIVRDKMVVTVSIANRVYVLLNFLQVSVMAIHQSKEQVATNLFPVPSGRYSTTLSKQLRYPRSRTTQTAQTTDLVSASTLLDPLRAKPSTLPDHFPPNRPENLRPSIVRLFNATSSLKNRQLLQQQ